MAVKATIFKVRLQVSDLNRHYYKEHALTVARHPSENDERMMLRVLAFALNACEELSFTRGLSTDDEPDLWERDLSGIITHWIELGQPDAKRLRKACGRAERVTVYTSRGSAADIWWQKTGEELQRFANLRVIRLQATSETDLTELTDRNMALQCTIDDDEIWITDGTKTIQLKIVVWKQIV